MMNKVETSFEYMSASPDHYALLKAFAKENRLKNDTCRDHTLGRTEATSKAL